MKIVLSNDLLAKINQKNFKSIINILTINKKSTIISIKGKTLEIPFTLNPNLKYIAEIKNNTLYIFEKNIKDSIFLNNKDDQKLFDNIKKILEKLFFNEIKNNFTENEINYLLFNKLYSKINNRKYKEEKYKNFILKNKKVDDYYFIFNLPYFNKLIKVFLKIDNNKNIFINIYSDKFKKSENDEFVKKLKDKMQTVSNVIKVNFFENIDDFYKNIFILFDLKKVDIKV